MYFNHQYHAMNILCVYKYILCLLTANNMNIHYSPFMKFSSKETIRTKCIFDAKRLLLSTEGLQYKA